MKTSEIDFRNYVIQRFCAISLFAGLFFVFFVPPIQPPDEDSHFARLMSIWFNSGELVEQDGGVGPILPRSLTDWIGSYRDMRGDIDARYSYDRWYTESQLNEMSSEPRIFYPHNDQNQSLVMFIPSLVGLAAGRVLYVIAPVSGKKFNYPAALYSARIGNLLFYVGGICLVLYLIPSFKTFIAFLALSPMSIHLASSVHYDTMSIVPAFLVFAVVLRWSNREHVRTVAEAAVLILSVFVLANGKLIYSVLALSAVPIIPWKEPRKALKYVSIAATAIVIGAVFNAFLFSAGQSKSLTFDQLQFVLHNPLTYAYINIKTVILHAEYLSTSAFVTLGSLDTNPPLAIFVLFYVVLMFSILNDSLFDKFSISSIQRISFAVSAFGAFAGVSLALYLTWTSHSKGIGAPLIDGLQGRYFIPLMPFALAAILPSVGALNRKARMRGAGATFFFAAWFLSAFFVIVLLRYWI